MEGLSSTQGGPPGDEGTDHSNGHPGNTQDSLPQYPNQSLQWQWVLVPTMVAFPVQVHPSGSSGYYQSSGPVTSNPNSAAHGYQVHAGYYAPQQQQPPTSQQQPLQQEQHPHHAQQGEDLTYDNHHPAVANHTPTVPDQQQVDAPNTVRKASDKADEPKAPSNTPTVAEQDGEPKFSGVTTELPKKNSNFRVTTTAATTPIGTNQINARFDYMNDFPVLGSAEKEEVERNVVFSKTLKKKLKNEKKAEEKKDETENCAPATSSADRTVLSSVAKSGNQARFPAHSEPAKYMKQKEQAIPERRARVNQKPERAIVTNGGSPEPLPVLFEHFSSAVEIVCGHRDEPASTNSNLGTVEITDNQMSVSNVAMIPQAGESSSSALDQQPGAQEATMKKDEKENPGGKSQRLQKREQRMKDMFSGKQRKAEKLNMSLLTDPSTNDDFLNMSCSFFNAFDDTINRNGVQSKKEKLRIRDAKTREKVLFDLGNHEGFERFLESERDGIMKMMTTLYLYREAIRNIKRPAMAFRVRGQNPENYDPPRAHLGKQLLDFANRFPFMNWKSPENHEDYMEYVTSRLNVYTVDRPSDMQKILKTLFQCLQMMDVEEFIEDTSFFVTMEGNEEKRKEYDLRYLKLIFQFTSIADPCYIRNLPTIQSIRRRIDTQLSDDQLKYFCCYISRQFRTRYYGTSGNTSHLEIGLFAMAKREKHMGRGCDEQQLPEYLQNIRIVLNSLEMPTPFNSFLEFLSETHSSIIMVDMYNSMRFMKPDGSFYTSLLSGWFSSTQ